MAAYSRRKLVASVWAACLISPSAYATNGYFDIGYGMKSKGMGGVAMAFPQDGLVPATNPAGISDIGSRADIGFELFLPPRRVAAENGVFDFQTPLRAGDSEADISKSGSNVFLIPSMGGSFAFTRKLSIGFAAVGNGANSRYERNFFQLTGVPPNEPYGTLGVQLIQMQMFPTVAYKVNKQHALGASLVIGVQQFRAYGLGNFDQVDPAAPDFNFSSDGAHLTNRGNDYSYGAGARLGYLGHFFDKTVSVGAAWGSKVYTTKFDDYRGLFAEDGGFDIPENFGVGLAVRPLKGFTLAFDAQKIMYSDVASIGNRHPTTSLQDICTRPISADPSDCLTPGATPQPRSRALGEDDGFGFGWDDQTAYKLGASYELTDRWTVRAGLNYGESPVPDDQILFNLLAPALTERHATIGFTYAPDTASEISGSYVHAFKHSQICAVNDGCFTMLTQEPGAYAAAELEIDSVGISYALKF